MFTEHSDEREVICSPEHSDKREVICSPSIVMRGK